MWISTDETGSTLDQDLYQALLWVAGFQVLTAQSARRLMQVHAPHCGLRAVSERDAPICSGVEFDYPLLFSSGRGGLRDCPSAGFVAHAARIAHSVGSFC